MKNKFIAVLLALFLVFAPANLALADNDGEHGKSDKNNSQGQAKGHEKKEDHPVGEKVDGPQGKSPSDPDGDENGGRDKPGGEGGTSLDKDGNNGSGNDSDCEDDNNGNGVPGHCKDKDKPSTPEVTPTPKPTKPANEKVTICHAAGKAGTTKYVTITISKNGLNGHFHNNGTPRAGHEEDYFGPCVSTPTTPTTPTKPEEPKVEVPKPEKPNKPGKPNKPTKPEAPKPDKPSKPVVTPTPDETETPVAVPGPERPALAKTGGSNIVTATAAGVLALILGGLLFAFSRLRRSE